MLIPYYKISSEKGFSGNKEDPTIYYCFPGIKPKEINRLNPYRDLQYGGTLLGYKGKNYWFSDETLLGKILKKIFA